MATQGCHHDAVQAWDTQEGIASCEDCNGSGQVWALPGLQEKCRGGFGTLDGSVLHYEEQPWRTGQDALCSHCHGLGFVPVSYSLEKVLRVLTEHLMGYVLTNSTPGNPRYTARVEGKIQYGSDPAVTLLQALIRTLVADGALVPGMEVNFAEGES